MVRWLHISDIHFITKDYETNIMRQKFIDKIKEKGKNYYKYLFITGDLLYKYGKDGDFSNVLSFFYELLELSGIPKENIFMVPGNHDVKRDKLTNAYIKDITEVKSEIKNKIEEMDSDEYFSLMNRQNSYIKFYNEFLGREYKQNELHNYFEKKDINVIEINSCLLAQSNDCGKLSIHMNRLNSVINKQKDGKKKLSIAILHHELEYLNDYESEQVKRLLIDKGFDFIFCGHTHENKYSKYMFGEKNLRKICCGALVAQDDIDINFVEGSFEGRYLEIIYYKWFKEFTDWRRNVYIDKSADESGIIKIKLEKDIEQVKDSLSKNKLCTDQIYRECEEKLGDIYTKTTMEKRYVEFIENSNKVYILVRDLDFLNKKTVESEKEKIKELGSKCKIIFEEKKEYSKEVNELIDEFKKFKVQLKTYPENDEDSIRNIKGQFKQNNKGNYECLVVGNKGFGENEDKVKLFDMNNRFLSQLFWKMIKDFFENEKDLKEV